MTTKKGEEYTTIKVSKAVSNIRSTDNGGTILLWRKGNYDNEQFVFFPLDGGTYVIVNKNSGKLVSFTGKTILVHDAIKDVFIHRNGTGAPQKMRNCVTSNQFFILFYNYIVSEDRHVSF